MSTADRLDSWKEIAAYLRRGVRTAQRWEREAKLPVHRVATERGSVYAFRSELDAWWQAQSATLTSEPIDDGRPSIAVLPFANLSTAADDAFIGDGLADEIINALAQSPDLRIIARTSSFLCHQQTQDVRMIGRLLNVRAVVQGSVRRSGNQLRVTAQLVDTNDGSCLWSGRHDRRMEDIFAIQDEVTRAIVSAVRGTFPSRALRHHTTNVAAYEAYLRARHHFIRATPGVPMGVRDFLGQAIALDPDFALAHANLGRYFQILAAVGLLSPQEGMQAARASGQRALDLDPSLADAQALLASVAAFYDHDWTEAERRFSVALASEPVAPSVRFQYASWYLLPLNRPVEAIAQLELGLRDDPLDLLGRLHVAKGLQALGRAEDAKLELDQILELDAHFGPALGMLGEHYVRQRKLDEALTYAEKTYAAIPDHPNAIGFFAGMLTRTGRAARADEVLQKLERVRPYSVARARANFHLVCGELDAAAGWVERAIEQRDPGVLILLSGETGNQLRASRRWPGLADKLNLLERT